MFVECVICSLASLFLHMLPPQPQLQEISFLLFSWETPAYTFKAFTTLYSHFNYAWPPAPEYKLWKIGEDKELDVIERTLASVPEGMSLNELALYLMVWKFLVNLITFLKLHMYNAWHIFFLHKWQLLLLCGINEIFVIEKYLLNEWAYEWVSEWMTNG